MRMHAGMAQYHCAVCGRGYHARNTKENHEEKCVEYVCKAKKVDRSRNIVLNKEMKQEQICGRKLYTKQAISQHKKAHADWDAKRKGTYEAPERNFVCDFTYVVDLDDGKQETRTCGASYVSQHNLNDHKLYCKYNEDRHGPFHCPEPACDRSKEMGGNPFTRPKDINHHIRKYHPHLSDYDTYKKKSSGSGGSSGGKAGGQAGSAKLSKK